MWPLFPFLKFQVKQRNINSKRNRIRHKNKATQRRERLATQKKEKQQKKRQQARAAPSDDLEEIERRKAKFQEKKARRLARKAEAAQDGNAAVCRPRHCRAHSARTCTCVQQKMS